MLDRTNAARQRRYIAKLKAASNPLAPRQRGLVIDAIRDKLTVLDGITRRSGNPIAAQHASDYRVILDTLLATWRTE